MTEKEWKICQAKDVIRNGLDIFLKKKFFWLPFNFEKSQTLKP